MYRSLLSAAFLSICVYWVTMTQPPRLVVITGVNGFVGTHVALKFLQEGWRVRGSVRSEEKRQIVLHNPIFAGMLDRLEVVVIESLASAKIEGFLGDCQARTKIYVGGTRNVIVNDTNSIFQAAAHSPNLEAVVLISAQRATDNGREDAYNLLTDDECAAMDPNDPGTFAKWYGRTKVLAEQSAVEWQKKTNASWSLTRFCPVIILGAYYELYQKSPEEVWKDKGDVTRMTNLLRGAEAELPPDPTVGYIDVRDVADAILFGLSEKLDGRFLIQGGVLRWAEEAERLKEIRPDLMSRIPKPRAPNEEDEQAHKAQERVQVARFPAATGLKYRSLDETLLDAMGCMDLLLGPGGNNKAA